MRVGHEAEAMVTVLASYDFPGCVVVGREVAVDGVVAAQLDEVGAGREVVREERLHLLVGQAEPLADIGRSQLAVEQGLPDALLVVAAARVLVGRFRDELGELAAAIHLTTARSTAWRHSRTCRRTLL